MMLAALRAQHIPEARIAILKLSSRFIAEQREHSGRAAARVAQRTGKNAIRNRAQRAAGGQAVDDDRLAAYLRHRQQLTVRARDHLAVRRLAARRADEHDALVRNKQRAHRAAQVVVRLLQDSLQLIGVVTDGVGRGGGIREQELQVLIERAHGAAEIKDRGAREQITAQAFERGTQQRVHERESARLGLRGAAADCQYRDQFAGIIAQPAKVHRHISAQHAQFARAVGDAGGKCNRFLDETD